MVPAAMKKTGGRFLARCLALLVLLAPGTAAPLTPAGTVIPHSFTARFATPTAQTLTSNESRVTVKDLADPSIIPVRSVVTPAGQPADFLHTVTNRGNSRDSFRLKASLLDGAQQGGSGVTMQFLAADGKTLLPTDISGFQVLGPIAPGASLDLVLRVTPPAGSEGRVDIITVSATSVQFPSRSSSVRDQLVVPLPGGVATPVIEVDPPGSVLGGTTLSYRILIANTGLVGVSGVAVSDPLNRLIEYEEGSAALPPDLPGSVVYDSATRTLNFQIANLPAGYSGALTFRARVASDAAGSAVVNAASLVSDLDRTPVPSNRTLTPVVSGAITIAMKAGSTSAEAGDLVPYTVTVENTGTVPLSHVTVYDKLPQGFRFLKGSGVVDGLSVANPTGAGQQVVWDLGTLEAGAAKRLGYRCAVSGDAPTGFAVNVATASANMALGGSVTSAPASAAVKVRSSILGDKAIILGRLFEDGNGNGVPDAGEAGVPNVRVYLEDGSYVFTDGEGQYSFTGVSAGSHVVKIDRSTLSPRYQPVPYNTAFAGIGWSQFITVPFGGPARGDFALAVKEGTNVPAGASPSAALPFTLDSASAPTSAPAASTADASSTASTASNSPSPVPPASAASPSPASGGPAIAALRVTPARIDMPADGKTVVPFTVELVDSQGRRTSGSSTVTVSTGKGVIVEPDQDPGLPGHQILAKDGIAVFRVSSGRSAGQDEILVTGDNGSRGRVDLYFSQELRDWIVVGLGNLTVGTRGVSGHIEKIDKEDRFDEGIFHEERLAFFTRGKILGRYLLTAAYDSDKERRDGVFQYIDPEKYYPVYGDASDIGYEAQSRGKLYLKLEAGRSYLLAGDYRTDLSENEFSRYDRALNGVKVEVDSEHLNVKGFESHTEETITRDEIAGNGTSGYYYLSRKPVLENSERIRIEVRDRYHSERLISVSEKLRYADYSIDYLSGAILFKEPVPSLDENLNPVTIVVNYQGERGGEKRYVYGGRAIVKSETGSYFGGTAVVEEGAVKNSTLYGLDAGIKLGERVSLKGEGAVSESLERGRGSAWKTELTARPFDSLTASGYYRKIDRDFYNISMTGNETGTEKYAGRLDYRGLRDTLIFAESFVQKDEINGIRQFGNQAGVVRKFSLLEGEGGFKRVEEEKNGLDGASNLLYAGIRGAITQRLEGTLRRDQLLSPSSVAEYQSRTFLKLDYRLTDTTRFFLTEEYQEGNPLIRQATRFGVESRLSEKMRLITGYQLSSGSGTSTEQSSVELNTRLLDREGMTLESRTGYQIENSLSEERGQAILGLNSRFRAAEGLYLNSTFERVQTVQGERGTRTAFTMAGEYLRQKDLKLTGRYEIRNGDGETASLYGAGLAYKATEAWTLLGKGTFSEKDADAGHDRLLDSYIGTSFRPLGKGLQLLTLARYKIDDSESEGTGENRSLIISAEPTYRIVRNWSAQGKYAGKWSWSRSSGFGYRSYTDLILAGLSYDLAERWELSAYLRLMNQYDTGQHSYGAVASAGFRVYRNVIVSAGYNYARLDDRDLTGESYQGQGPFFGVKVKFDEDMFPRSEPAVVQIPAPLPKPPVIAETPAVVPPKPPPVPALLVAAARVDEPLHLSGSAELLTLLVNGERVQLPSTAVTVGRERLAGSVDVRKGKLSAPVNFLTSVEKPELVESWTLSILDGKGRTVRALGGKGAPQRRISWRGEGGGKPLSEGEIYQYQLQVSYLDGSVVSTGRELFGVNRREAVLLTLAGGAFVFDTWNLTPEAKRLLKGAARTLRAHPQDKVIVEGHTDSIGTEQYNMELSRKRCEAAADFLEREEGIPAARLIRRWYGESRPVADNRTSPGRKLNRRVELKGDFEQRVPVAPDDRYRGAAFVTINGRDIALDRLGRFQASVPAETTVLKVEMGDSLGRSVATTLPAPSLVLAEPAGEKLVPYGKEAGWLKVAPDGAARCLLTGEVERGATLEVEGKAVPLDEAGRFKVELPLAAGEQVFGMVVRNGAGCAKLINVRVLSTPQGPAAEGREP